MSDRTVKGHIFNVQSYCIHDGPGIRATVFVKGCPLKCLWCQNPESQQMHPELMFYVDKCVGCGSCSRACARNAIHWEAPKLPAGTTIDLQTQSGEPEISKPRTDRSLCIACGDCVKVCPANAREISGKTVTVEEALKEVLADKLFFDGSGGGMTISGGEPLMQPEFTTALFRAAQEEGVHTAIETCNFAVRDVIDQVYRYVDLAICDIKHMDSAIHRKITGVPNELILENIRHIRCDLEKPMNIRTPVVPGFNGDLENIEATARFIHKYLGTDVMYSLLPYHRLGESKGQSLERENYELHVDPPTDAYMQQCAELVEKIGIRAHIGG